jgi:hypothetical protein
MNKTDNIITKQHNTIEISLIRDIKLNFICLWLNNNHTTCY